MPFKRSDAYKLAIAVAAAFATTHAFAASSDKGWACAMNAAGEWDCQVSDEPPPEPETTASTQQAPEQPVEQSPSSQPQTAVTQTTPTAPANTEQATITAAPAAAAVATQSPISTQESNQAAVARHNPNQNTPWDCTANGDSWDCSYAGPSPAPGSTPTRSANSSQAQVAAAVALPANARAARDGQNTPWDCTANGDSWDCSYAGGGVASSIGNMPTTTQGQAIQQVVADSSQPYAYLDWYFYNQGEQPTTSYCPGRYVQQDLEALKSKPKGDQTVYIDALNSVSALNGLTQLDGGINLQQGQRALSSDSGDLDRNSRIATLSGNVRYSEPGLLLLATEARADLNDGTTEFNNAQYVMHNEHMRGQANQIARQSDNHITMSGGSITYCEPGNNGWAINADELVIKPEEGYGEARGATLRVADVPVMYLPYFYFPIDDTRRSGFLYPTIRFSDTDGLDLSAPYYLNLAPNYDDTITPRIITERGLMLENTFRYLGDWSMNSFSTAYMADDQDYDDQRWLVGLKHDGNPYDRWYTKIDFSRVSDKDYFKDLDTTSFGVRNHDDLDQLAEVMYQADTWSFATRVHAYQTTNDDKEPYEMMPQLILKGREVAFGNSSALSYVASYTQFDRNTDSSTLTPEEKVTGSRLHLRPTLTASLENSWGYIKPALGYWYSSYKLDDQPNGWQDSPTLSVPIASIDSGLTFERSYGEDKTQTFEPRLKLLSVDKDIQEGIPEFDSSRLDVTYNNLFNDIGYSGSDRIAGTQQATLGLSSAFYDDSGRQLTRVGIAQSYYFEDRDPGMGLRPGDVSGEESSSNYAAMIDWNITPTLRFTHDSEIERSGFSLRQQNYSLTYQPDDQRLLYLSYRDNSGIDNFDDPDDEVRQTDFAFSWPVAAQWNLIGRWEQDLLRSTNLETLLGVEYSSCCWKVRLTARDWLDDYDAETDDKQRTSGVFLQFVLRGLGSFGESGGREFLDDITGNDEESHDKF